MNTPSTGHICEAVLMPHAPVLIPEVGGGRECAAQATVDALRSVARKLVATAPDAVVVISPHSPRRAGRFGLWSGEWLSGDMGRFGRSDLRLKLPLAQGVAAAVEQGLVNHGLQVWDIGMGGLDHGALVPLYFLHRSGWEGPTVVLGLNYPGEGGAREAGAAIREAAEQTGLRIAVVASGDMSHRLRPGAPAGYDPVAKEFDQEFVRIIRAGRYEQLEHLDAALQELAAEDVLDSTLIAVHAAEMQATGHTVYSYEGPFGVGYCVAELYRADGSRHPGQLLPRIARDAVEQHFRPGAPVRGVAPSAFLDRPAAVFVTIRTRDGRLRGCRGTLVPRSRNVVEETRSVALSSALQDTRFDPVTEAELPDLIYEVSVLRPAEPVASAAELDPRRYGVIVSTPDGRRGLMLPEVEGLDTVQQQIEATCRKAHIDPGEPLSLERFTADKFGEN